MKRQSMMVKDNSVALVCDSLYRQRERRKDPRLKDLLEVPRMDDWRRTALGTDRARWEAISSDLSKVEMTEVKANREEWQGG